MKIQRFTPNKKKSIVFTTVFIVILLTIFSAIYLVSGSLFGWNPLGIVSTDDSIDEQVNNERRIKVESLETNNGASGSDQPLKPTTDEIGNQKVEVDISSVNRVDDTIKVSVLISVLDQSGSCTLIVTGSDHSTLYRTTVGVQAMSSVSTCKGFDIPANGIPENNYTLTVSFTSGKMYGSVTYEAK